MNAAAVITVPTSARSATSTQRRPDGDADSRSHIDGGAAAMGAAYSVPSAYRGAARSLTACLIH